MIEVIYHVPEPRDAGQGRAALRSAVPSYRDGARTEPGGSWVRVIVDAGDYGALQAAEPDGWERRGYAVIGDDSPRGRGRRDIDRIEDARGVPVS